MVLVLLRLTIVSMSMRRQIPTHLARFGYGNLAELTFDETLEVVAGMNTREEMRPVFAAACADAVRGMTATEFHAFLRDTQARFAVTPEAAVALMEKHNRDASDPAYLTFAGFQSFLASAHNDIFSYSRQTAVYNDMSRPLSHFWISSSHNTYLEVRRRVPCLLDVTVSERWGGGKRVWPCNDWMSFEWPLTLGG